MWSYFIALKIKWTMRCAMASISLLTMKCVGRHNTFIKLAELNEHTVRQTALISLTTLYLKNQIFSLGFLTPFCQSWWRYCVLKSLSWFLQIFNKNITSFCKHFLVPDFGASCLKHYYDRYLLKHWFFCCLTKFALNSNLNIYFCCIIEYF